MTDAKVDLVQSWLLKARRDLISARVLAAHTPPLLDTSIYHCQQSAEKAVKGYLVFCDQEFERVHDLGFDSQGNDARARWEKWQTLN